MKQLAHIGTIELVSLPNDAIQDIPAKIDTGADGSVIWASTMVLAGRPLAQQLSHTAGQKLPQKPLCGRCRAEKRAWHRQTGCRAGVDGISR
jgi:hypothetical protein